MRLPLPIKKNAVGLLLHQQHFYEVYTQKPSISFCEIKRDNFICDGGSPLAWLKKIRADYPISLDGITLSLGSSSAPSKHYLKSLKTLIDQTEPLFVSDYLGWSCHKKFFLNSCIPCPYTDESLRIISSNILIVQEFIKKPLLIANPASYLVFKKQDYEEGEFMKELCKKTGCGLVLDLNNLYISSHYAGIKRGDSLKDYRLKDIEIIRIAGPSYAHGDLVGMDDQAVQKDLWMLYEDALMKGGTKLTTIQWNNKIPPLSSLLKDVIKAKTLLKKTDSRKDQSYEAAC